MSVEKDLTADPLYAPFLRSDKYGELGLGPLPWPERLRLALFTVLVVPVKLLGALTCLLSFFAFCRVSFLLPASVRSDAIAALGKLHCRCCLFWLGFVRITWIRVGAPGASAGGAADADASAPLPAGIVSNHCGWTDILVQMARFFPAFVARDKTEHTPFIGIISQKMGCIYVNRDTNGGVSARVKEYMQSFGQGKLAGARPLLLFPEGTTTNGTHMLPFKTGAFLAGEPVQPVVLQYSKEHVSPSWDSIAAARHIYLMLCNPLHSVRCFQLPVYVPNAAEKADPVLYAANVRRYMMDFAGLKDTRATFQDKKRLTAFLRAKHGLEPAATAARKPKKTE